VCGILAALALCLLGCKKKQEAPSAAPIAVNGVSVDLPQLRLSITNKECQSYFDDIQNCFRYGSFKQAEDDIQKVADHPDLTEEQKAAAAKVLDQIKQVRAAATGGVR